MAGGGKRGERRKEDSFIHSSNKYIPSTYYVAGPLLENKARKQNGNGRNRSCSECWEGNHVKEVGQEGNLASGEGSSEEVVKVVDREDEWS